MSDLMEHGGVILIRGMMLAHLGNTDQVSINRVEHPAPVVRELGAVLQIPLDDYLGAVDHFMIGVAGRVVLGGQSLRLVSVEHLVIPQERNHLDGLFARGLVGLCDSETLPEHYGRPMLTGEDLPTESVNALGASQPRGRV